MRRHQTVFETQLTCMTQKLYVTNTALLYLLRLLADLNELTRVQGLQLLVCLVFIL